MVALQISLTAVLVEKIAVDVGAPVECVVILLGRASPWALYTLTIHCLTHKATVDFVTLLPRFWLLCEINKTFKSLNATILSR